MVFVTEVIYILADCQLECDFDLFLLLVHVTESIVPKPLCCKHSFDPLLLYSR